MTIEIPWCSIVRVLTYRQSAAALDPRGHSRVRDRAELDGVIGALVALPVAAMYPTIENLWLAGRLASEVAADHRRIEHTKEH